MHIDAELAVRQEAKRQGLQLDGLELRDEHGLICERVDLTELGLFLGVLVRAEERLM